MSDITPELKAIQDGIAALETTLAKKQDARIEEKMNGFHLPAVDKKMQDMEGQLAKLEGELKDAHKQMLDMATKAGRMGEGEEVKSAGQAFTDSAAYKNRQDAAGNVRIKVEMKALLGTTASVGSTVRPQRLPFYQGPQEPHIRDLFAQGTTNSSSLEFPQIKAWTNAAAAVLDDGVTKKPESNLTTELVTFPVRTIAHIIRVHKNILDDEPALRSLIDQKLLDGLDDVEDIELIKGDGTGAHLRGVLMNAKTFTRTVVGDTKLDVLRRALTDLRLRHFRADGMVLNPLDWEDIELLKGTDGKYIWVNVPDGGVPRLWRAPVVDSIAVDENQFVAGAFRQGGQIFDRQAATIEVFEQDQDNVSLNLITIRAEKREALVIYDQNAFVKGTFPA